MDLMLVFDIFLSLTGLEKEDAIKWIDTCRSAADSISADLKEDCDISNNMSSLTYAAAACAFYEYVLISSSFDGNTSFKAGDLSIRDSASERISASRQLRDEALKRISRLMKNGDFEFVAIQC